MGAQLVTSSTKFLFDIPGYGRDFLTKLHRIQRIELVSITGQRFWCAVWCYLILFLLLLISTYLLHLFFSLPTYSCAFCLCVRLCLDKRGNPPLLTQDVIIASEMRRTISRTEREIQRKSDGTRIENQTSLDKNTILNCLLIQCPFFKKKMGKKEREKRINGAKSWRSIEKIRLRHQSNTWEIGLNLSGIQLRKMGHKFVLVQLKMSMWFSSEIDRDHDVRLPRLELAWFNWIEFIWSSTTRRILRR